MWKWSRFINLNHRGLPPGEILACEEGTDLKLERLRLQKSGHAGLFGRVFAFSWCHLAGFLVTDVSPEFPLRVWRCRRVKFRFNSLYLNAKWSGVFFLKVWDCNHAVSQFLPEQESIIFLHFSKPSFEIAAATFLIISPLCSIKSDSSAAPRCSFPDWFSLRGVGWKAQFYLHPEAWPRRVGDGSRGSASSQTAADNLSAPRVAWVKAPAGCRIKQTLFPHFSWKINDFFGFVAKKSHGWRTVDNRGQADVSFSELQVW